MQPSLHVATSTESTFGKKNGTKWKHRSLAKSDKLLKQGFKDWQRNGFFENHEKRYVVTCRDNWATPQRSCAWRVRQARRGSQIKEGTGSSSQTVVATWYSLVSICSACQTTSEIAKSEKDRAICFSLGHLCSWANLGPEWHIGAYGYDIKHVHGTLDHLLSENWRGKMVFCSQAAAMKLIAKGWGKRFSSRKW
jgi:hypothetical protein